MYVLLPPSEAKRPGGRGRPLSARRPHPQLGEAREQVLTALEKLLTGPAEDAARALLLPPATVDGALRANAAARSARTVPALQRYAGVVYDGLASLDLDTSEQRHIGRSTLIFSGLFGVVRGDEPVPDYRVPAKAVLPGLGVAGTFWRAVLDTVVPDLLARDARGAARTLVIDLRSSDYAAMWRPRCPLAERTVTVRVLSPLPGGGEGVVSYPSKFAKGRLAAALARRERAGSPVRSVDDVAAAWLAVGGADAEVVAPDRLIIRTGASALAR